jgi:hypothetical protein
MTLQQSPYLREQRQFPNDDLQELSNQVDHAYIDIASKVNARSVGLYANNFQIVTGNSWFLNGSAQRQQTLRQVYQFTAAGNIPHGINFATLTSIPIGFGGYTDGTNWYGVIYATSVAIPGQISFYVTPTNIVVLLGGGAPAITSGSIVLEWLSQY